MANYNSVRHLLINNAAATGPETKIGQGGLYAFSVIGTFSGASVKLQIRGGDDVTYVDIPDAVCTAANVIGVYLPAGAFVKAVVTGGPPSGIYARLSLVD